jgi:hypothetical protein
LTHWPQIFGALLLAGPLVCGTSQAANDWFDREVDAINEPQRPIPSGKIPGRWGLAIALIGTTAVWAETGRLEAAETPNASDSSGARGRAVRVAARCGLDGNGRGIARDLGSCALIIQALTLRAKVPRPGGAREARRARGSEERDDGHGDGGDHGHGHVHHHGGHTHPDDPEAEREPE